LIVNLDHVTRCPGYFVRALYLLSNKRPTRENRCSNGVIDIEADKACDVNRSEALRLLGWLFPVKYNIDTQNFTQMFKA